MMVNKYARALEAREINDLPNLWRKKVIAKIEEDGYTIDDDGTVIKE